MKVRGGLSELKFGLREEYSLRHREDVRIRYRYNIDAVIKILRFDNAFRTYDVVGIFRREIIREDVGKKIELLLLCIVQPLMNCGHDLCTLFKKCNCRSDRRLLIAVPHLQIGNSSEPLTRFHAKAHQLE